ncbi:MAG: threonine--tRNA ligase [Cytophagales bacterium]|tara:strand:- start:33 stop:1964 length:1932 start_codon:yes stop_codon:yes gene_type:complete
MSEINVQFPDNSNKKFQSGISCLEIVKSISNSLAKKVLVASYNENLIDLSTKLTTDGKIKFYTWDDTEGKSTFWHSSAHLLAESIESLYPGVKFGIGPPISNGFYYDIDFVDYDVSKIDLSKIEEKFLSLSRENLEFKKSEVSKKDALSYFKEKGDNLKLDLIKDLNDGEISFYKQGNFTDLCKGPHIPSSKFIKSFKILNTAGAYWRGDENNKQLTRLYAVSFPKLNMLEEHLIKLEEAKKRDHRKLGKELELFFFSDKVGSGLPMWLPNGHIIRENLIEFMRKEQISQGYQHVTTPHIGAKDLYVTSGHYDKYGESSFQPIEVPSDNEEYLLKPMNCPHHCEIYNFKPHSYKELPIRIAEFGTVYRYEQSGELHGMTRVRGFTQDDAHIFCTIDQVKDEVLGVMDLILKVFKSLSFDDYKVQISLRDKNDSSKYIGDSNLWDKAENDLVDAVEGTDIEAEVVHGEAAFYGPKIDFMVKDSLDREWQLGTIQVDYQLPKRFNLEYVDKNNSKKRPVLIHRAPFGSLERFIAILTEHCEGNFPLWIAPNQVIILPINEKVNDYAKKIKIELDKLNYRTSIDHRIEKVSKKIRDAEVKKIPYMLIIGEDEMKSGTVSVRKKSIGDKGKVDLENLISMLDDDMKS